MPVLRVLSGPYTGQQFPLSTGSVELGREPDCAICLADDNGISRRHARLEIQPGQVVAHDLGSRNGVLVNGARTASTILQPGDQVQLGNTVMVLEADPMAPSLVATPPPAVFSPPQTQGYPSGMASPMPGVAPGGYPSGMPGAAPGGYLPGMPGAYPPGAYPPAYGGYQGLGPPPPAVPFAKLLYFIGFSIPPIGIIIGLIYMLKETPDEQKVGKWLLFWSILGGVLLWVSYVEVMNLIHGFMTPGGQQIPGTEPAGGMNAMKDLLKNE